MVQHLYFLAKSSSFRNCYSGLDTSISKKEQPDSDGRWYTGPSLCMTKLIGRRRLWDYKDPRDHKEQQKSNPDLRVIYHFLTKMFLRSHRYHQNKMDLQLWYRDLPSLNKPAILLQRVPPSHVSLWHRHEVKTLRASNPPTRALRLTYLKSRIQ